MSIIHVLGESAVRSLALALAVALVLRVLRVEHAHLAKRAWTAVLILALAMPALVAVHIPSFSFLALWSTPRTVILPAKPAVSAQDTFTLDTLLSPSRDRSPAFSPRPVCHGESARSRGARGPTPDCIWAGPSRRVMADRICSLSRHYHSAASACPFGSEPRGAPVAPCAAVCYTGNGSSCPPVAKSPLARHRWPRHPSAARSNRMGRCRTASHARA